MTTWNAEIYGFAIFGTFTGDPGPGYLRGPDKDKLRQKRGRRQSRRIRNDMDESEAGPKEVRCTKCNGTGHTYKKCTANNVQGQAEAGPSGNPQDGRRPRERRASRRSDGAAR